MAFNIILPGVGEIVATDQVVDAQLGGATVKTEYIKIMDGTVGGTVKAHVTANGLQVEVAGNVAQGAVDSGNPIKIGGVYRASAPTLADGQRAEALFDPYSNLKVTSATLSSGEDINNQILGISRKPAASPLYSVGFSLSFGSVAAVTPKISNGNVFSFHATNNNASLRWFQIFNKASTPVANDVPVFQFPIPPISGSTPGEQTKGADFFGLGGYFLSAGVSWAISQVPNLLTLATPADHNVQLGWI